MDIQISKAEWFAAHAPEVPEWFNPTVPDAPMVRDCIFNQFGTNKGYPSWGAYYDFEGSEWYDPDNKVPDALKKEISEWDAARSNEVEAQGKWRQDIEMAKLTQWSVHYGRLMAEAFSKDTAADFRSTTHYLIRKEYVDGRKEHDLVFWHRPNNHYHIPITETTFVIMRDSFGAPVSTQEGFITYHRYYLKEL